MDADDPRHGTLNGYNTHNRDGEKACDACLAGRAATRKDTRKGKAEARPKPRVRADFISAGYSPNDGLTGGRWMWDDLRAIRVWVRTDEVA